MRLVSYLYKEQLGIGAVVDEELIPGAVLSNLPTNLLDFIKQGECALDDFQALINSGQNRMVLADVRLLAPIPRPGKYLAISLNYADHIEETGRDRPEFPSFFTKQSTCIIAHGEAIHRPKVSSKLDYEGELAFVIGQRCRHVSVEKAHQVIAGYMIANDVSVRDWQFRSPTFTIGKSFDTCGPLGPWMVTKDEIDDPHNLAIKTWVDDELRQNSNTRYMLFNCYEMIAYLSQAMTLEPGDIISTGTPKGVGVKMEPRGYLKPGQTVTVEIERIGKLTNPVIQEP